MRRTRKIRTEQMEGFRRACVDHGIKITQQREEIFRAVISTGEHPDAVTVHRCVKKSIPSISLDTVYRNLKLLSEYGLISIVGMSHESVRFDGNMAPHHHFTCVRCGRIHDFLSEGAGGLAPPDEARSFGKPLSVHLEVKGVCTACQGA